MSSVAFSPNLKVANTGYSLRQRTHNLTVPMYVSAVIKQNFVYTKVVQRHLLILPNSPQTFIDFSLISVW